MAETEGQKTEQAAPGGTWVTTPILAFGIFGPLAVYLVFVAANGALGWWWLAAGLIALFVGPLLWFLRKQDEAAEAEAERSAKPAPKAAGKKKKR